MTSAGLGDFVVKNREEYLERVRYWVNNPRKLDDIRKTIRAKLASNGYFNIEVFARDLEDAYRYMWRRWIVSNPA